MREVIKDIQSEHFTKWECIKYGIIYPTAFMTLCGLAGWIETISY